MGPCVLRKFVLVSIFLLLSLFLIRSPVPARNPGEYLNPLRFQKEEKVWQLGLAIKLNQSRMKYFSISESGPTGTRKQSVSYLIRGEGSFDLSRRLGLEGYLDLCYFRSRRKTINFWSGRTAEEESSSLNVAGTELSLQYEIYTENDLRVSLSVPVVSPALKLEVGWSRDPVMFFPKLAVWGSGMEVTFGSTFVANEKIAFSGSMFYRTRGDDVTVGYSGSTLYRFGKYRGLRFAGGLSRGEVLNIHAGVKLLYGKARGEG